MSSDTRKRAASAPVSTPDTPPTKVPAPDAAAPDPDATIPSKQEVDDIVQQLLSHACAEGKHAHESLTRIREFIKERRDELTNFHCNYLFFGKQGAGKSRLINRILHPEGKGRCPMPTSDGSTSVTSVIIRIRRSEAFSVTVHFQDPSQPIPELARIAERHQVVSSMNDLTAALAEINKFLQKHPAMQENVKFLDVHGDFPIPSNVSLFDLPGIDHLDPEGVHKSLLDEIFACPSVLMYLTNRLYVSTRSECPALRLIQRFPRLPVLVNVVTKANEGDVEQLDALRSSFQEKIEESSVKLFDSLPDETYTIFFRSNLAQTVRNAQVFLAGESLKVHETIVVLFQDLQTILETDLTKDLLGLALGYDSLCDGEDIHSNQDIFSKYNSTFSEAWKTQTKEAVDCLSGILADRAIAKHSASLRSSSHENKKAWMEKMLGQIGDIFHLLREIVVGNHRDSLAISAVNMAIKASTETGSPKYITSWARHAKDRFALLDLLVRGSHTVIDGVRSICTRQGAQAPADFGMVFIAARVLSAHALVQLSDFHRAAESVRLDVLASICEDVHQEASKSPTATAFNGSQIDCSKSKLIFLENVDRIWSILESDASNKHKSIKESCNHIMRRLVGDMHNVYKAKLSAPTEAFFTLLCKHKSTKSSAETLARLPHIASLSPFTSLTSPSTSFAHERAEGYLRAIHSSFDTEDVARFLDAFDTLQSIDGALNEASLKAVINRINKSAVSEARDVREVRHPFVLITEEGDSKHDGWSPITSGRAEEMVVDGQIAKRAAELQQDRSVHLRTSRVDKGTINMNLTRTPAAAEEIKYFLARSAKRRSLSADKAPAEDMLVYPTFNILATHRAVEMWQPLWCRGIYAPRQTATSEERKGKAAANTLVVDHMQGIKMAKQQMAEIEEQDWEEWEEDEEEASLTDDDIFHLDMVVCLAHLEEEARKKVDKMKTPCVLVIVDEVPEFLEPESLGVNEDRLEEFTTRFLLDVASSLAAHFSFPFWWLVPLDTTGFMLLRRSALKNVLCSPCGALLHVQTVAEALEQRYLQDCSKEHQSMLDAIKYHVNKSKDRKGYCQLLSPKLSQFQLLFGFGMAYSARSGGFLKVPKKSLDSQILIGPSLVTPVLFNTCAAPISTFLRAIDPSGKMYGTAELAQTQSAKNHIDCELRNAVHLMFAQRRTLTNRTNKRRRAVLIIDGHITELRDSSDSIAENVDQEEN